MRQPQAVGQRAGTEDGLRGAAAAFPVAFLVGPQLERHGHDLVALCGAQMGYDRAVDAAAQPHEDAVLVGWGKGGVAPRRVGQRPVQGVGREVGGVAACRARGRPAPPRSTLAEIRAASSTVFPWVSKAHALPAAIVAPQPSASKVTRVSRPSSTHTAIRTTSPHAEPPALPTNAPSGTGPRPCGSVRCCSKGCTPRSLDSPVGELC